MRLAISFSRIGFVGSADCWQRYHVAVNFRLRKFWRLLASVPLFFRILILTSVLAKPCFCTNILACTGLYR